MYAFLDRKYGGRGHLQRQAIRGFIVYLGFLDVVFYTALVTLCFMQLDYTYTRVSKSVDNRYCGAPRYRRGV
jgi:hypothetical protein